MPVLRHLLRVLTTIFLLLVTLGLGSIGLCAVNGLPKLIHAPFYLATGLLVIAIAAAGIHAAIVRIRDVWQDRAKEPVDGA